MSKTNNAKRTGQNNLQIAMILGLGAIEFLLASIWILFISPDPKNAYLFGFSLARLIIFSFGVALSLATACTAIRFYRRGIPEHIYTWFTAHAESCYFVVLLMLLAVLALLTTPPDSMGTFHAYFERLRPLFIVLGLLPVQVSIPALVRRLNGLGQKFLGRVLVVLIIMTMLWSLVAVTRLGITPESYFWNIAAMPITAQQYVLFLLACMLGLGMVTFFREHIKVKPAFIDILLASFLYLLATVIWTQTPMVKHYFSLQPVAPYYQPYPFSDAMYLDLGALSIIRGYGINFGQFTDKPFYMVFLAFLHRLGGFDYDLITRLQILVMALMAPVLYWLGKTFHSRFFGMLMAVLIIYRQANAIMLAHIVASVNPRLFMTEIPTMLGIIIFVCVAFIWLGRRPFHLWLAIISGGLLGVICLIRINPIALLPVVLFLCLVIYSKKDHAWIKPSIFFLLGFVILFSLWMLTGIDQQGNSFFLIKIQDVLNIRYSSASQVPGSTQTINTLENKSTNGSTPETSTVPPPNSLFPAGLVKIDVTKFPAFVANHAIHNIVDSFLALPDSLSESDQDLNNLARRPYWVDALAQTWQGQVEPVQIPFILANLVLLAIGLAWSWKCWHWAGLLPLIVFLTYCLSLGFARNSGSRYTVPVDWIVFFYFALGLLALAEMLPPGILKLMQADPASDELQTQLPDHRPYTRRMLYASVTFVFVTALLVPLTQVPVLITHQKCQGDFVFPENQPGMKVGNQKSLIGEVLYPRIINNGITFIFNSCGWAPQFDIPDTSITLYDSQPVLVRISDPNLQEIDAIYQLDSYSKIQLLWQK